MLFTVISYATTAFACFICAAVGFIGGVVVAYAVWVRAVMRVRKNRSEAPSKIEPTASFEPRPWIPPDSIMLSISVQESLKPPADSLTIIVNGTPRITAKSPHPEFGIVNLVCCLEREDYASGSVLVSVNGPVSESSTVAEDSDPITIN